MCNKNTEIIWWMNYQGMFSFIYLFHSNFPNWNRDSLIMGYFQLISLTEHSMSYAEDTRIFNGNQLSSTASRGYVKQHVLNTLNIFLLNFLLELHDNYDKVAWTEMFTVYECIWRQNPMMYISADFCICLVYRTLF